MATETFFLPGYGVVVDEDDGDEVFIPGYGVVANNEAPPDETVSDYRFRQRMSA